MKKSFLLFLVIFACIFVGCNDDHLTKGLVYDTMPPGCKIPEMFTADPGKDVTFSAILTDVHGLKSVNVSCETIGYEHTTDLTGKTVYQLNETYTVPSDIILASEHEVTFTIVGNSDTFIYKSVFLASAAIDYDVMYLAFEGETVQQWKNCLNKQALPCAFTRTAPYNYSVSFYSPEEGFKLAILGQPDFTPDRYGTDPNNPDKIVLGQDFLKTPGEGYYSLSLNMQTKDYTFTRLDPSTSEVASLETPIYVVGSLMTCNWTMTEGINDMVPVYPQNKYLVRRTMNFINPSEGSFGFRNKDKIWKPLKGYNSWDDMGLFVIWNNQNNSSESNTKDIWLKAPRGRYEITFDYFLNRATIMEVPAPDVEDYQQMYWAFEGEQTADWDNALTGLPRIAERTAEYTYKIKLYSPKEGTKVKLLAEPDPSAEGYGADAGEITYGGYITLPDKGYYEITANLQESKCQVTQLTPTTTLATNNIYFHCKFRKSTSQGWSRENDNTMQVLYSDNPYLLTLKHRLYNISDSQQGDMAFQEHDGTKQIRVWEPAKGHNQQWSAIKQWLIPDNNTEKMWALFPKTPGPGEYEIMFDYFLGNATVVKIND